ncbi:AT-hook motif nuclear-localized protein [Heracleum sosnowskyi]|uniref:AT-hook motif nuclear-localized protein n=1 Tax=Heracleum sosnowskyi TaxID=360622 RepID=A0AAD8JBY5_9APIA|nr:AT-hook motif nuclear-localized protein [Heracleum sosnowskyi]
MEGSNNQGENSPKILQQLLPPEPHHSDSETNPQNSSGVAGGPSPKRRQRGRPPGSKNKLKPPVLIPRESPNALKSHVFEVSVGADIMESLNTYARQRGRGVCVLNGKGTVSNVIIRQPMSSSGSVVTLQGAFEILSITGTVLPSPAPPDTGSLSIFLSGGQGQVLGGVVVGPLIATGSVILMAASFANAVYERLPMEGRQAVEQEDAGNGANQVQQVQPVTSQASTVTGTVGVGLPLLIAGPANNVFSGDLIGWGGSNASAPGPPF